MRYEGRAIPVSRGGISFKGRKKIVVPDQGLSLKDILDRFVRGEVLPVGMSHQFGDEDQDNPLNVDLEKLAVADLVDKEEYKEQLKEVKRKYDIQEMEIAVRKKAAEDEAAKKKDALRIKKAAEKYAKENLAGSA